MNAKYRLSSNQHKERVRVPPCLPFEIDIIKSKLALTEGIILAGACPLMVGVEAIRHRKLAVLFSKRCREDGVSKTQNALVSRIHNVVGGPVGETCNRFVLLFNEPPNCGVIRGTMFISQDKCCVQSRSVGASLLAKTVTLEDSIPSNIAEGCGRNSDAELARYCSMAAGSASELEYHLLLARDLNLIPLNDYPLLAEQIVEIKRMLTGFVQKLTADR